jgi:hypothetical protein
LQFDDVYTCHVFLQITFEFEKAVSKKKEVSKPLEQFVDRRFGNVWQLALNKVHETLKMIVCNSKIVSLGAT